jgi:hypothetical protein
LLAFSLAGLIVSPSAFAQTTTGAQSTTAQNSATPPARQDDPDRDINLAQPDFTLAALPTTLRLPRFGSSFRVTHRFGRPLGQGDFGDLLDDMFGLDGGALIGLEYRFGIFRGAQLGFYRTSNKTIQLFGQYDLMNQRNGFPLGIAVYGTFEGTNNMHDSDTDDDGVDDVQASYSPGIGVLLSREISDWAAVYVEPFWVNNTNSLPKELVDDNSTVIVGLGLRLRIRPTVYVLVEGAPRVTGYDPDVDHVSFGIEKRAGRHSFQLNFSNGFGTTLADIARGGVNNDDWFLGFQISRKFF